MKIGYVIRSGPSRRGPVVGDCEPGQVGNQAAINIPSQVLGPLFAGLSVSWNKVTKLK